MKTTSKLQQTVAIGTALSALLFAGAVHAWAAVSAEPAVGPPTSQVTVTGQHFTPNSPVEVFLKWKRCSVTTDADGAFSCTVKVPKVLEPGVRKIWTVDRTNGRWLSTPFTVRTDWGNAAFDGGRTRYNPFENVLNASNVGQLKKLWSAPGTLQLVSGGRVFVQNSEGLIGTQALNDVDGAEVWRLAPPTTVLASAHGRT